MYLKHVIKLKSGLLVITLVVLYKMQVLITWGITFSLSYQTFVLKILVKQVIMDKTFNVKTI